MQLFMFSSSRRVGYQLQSTAPTKCDTTNEYNSGLPVEDSASSRCRKSSAAGDKSYRQCGLELQLPIVRGSSSYSVQHLECASARQNKLGGAEEETD